MKKNELFNYVTSKTNIYNAIYSLNSYVFEKGLLDDEEINVYKHPYKELFFKYTDKELFYQLKDKYNFDLIDCVIEACQKRLTDIFNNNKLFDIQVYYKMKKYDNETNQIIYRPIHAADLITQICIVSLLNVIAFDDSTGSRELSDVSELIPSNFYGNIPSPDIKQIFYDWHIKYKEYSQDVIEAYNTYEKTGEYKYEVCLDLENFFPSINPDIIYNILLKKLSIVYKNNSEDLKKILEKLLFFNITNIHDSYEKYYPINENVCKNLDKTKLLKKNKYPSLGIPQGLPQAYYFGNICMIEIAKLINEEFSGKSFYYVDDSVIYTNRRLSDKEEFKKLISELNKKINQTLNDLIIEECSKNPFDHYKINIHEDEKSTYSDIMNEKKYGRSFLKQINIGTSTVTFDILTAIDELQDETIREKTEMYSSAIEEEIKYIKDKIKDQKSNKHKNETNDLETYLKLLKRYKKFFSYRFKLIQFSLEGLKEEDINKYYDKYKIKQNTFDDKNKQDFFEIFNEDIFAAEASLFLKFADRIGKKNEVYNLVSTFEKNMCKDIPDKNLYFSKTLKNNIITSKVNDSYASLKSMNCKYIEKYRKYQTKDILNNINNIIKDISNKKLSTTKIGKRYFLVKKLKDKHCSLDSKLRKYSKKYGKLSIEDIKKNIIIKPNSFVSRKYDFLGFELKEYTKFVAINSNEFKLKILNCLISQIFSVEVSNGVNIIKSNNRTLTYLELRILMYIRNKNSKYRKAIDFIQQVISDKKSSHTNDKIDYSILEALNIFRTYVKYPEYIDQLIITHKYITSVWKNGAKNLYFYTLHNQEHSVELIRFTISICKSVDFLKIKAIDYYILFLACYLHDISMILQPNFNSFITDKYDAEILFTEWKEQYDKMQDDKSISENLVVKNFILDWYKRVDEYFENDIRSKHAKNSSNFIKKTHDLDYIDCAIRNIVANVSEAHGYDEGDVYGLKSKGQSEAINIKFLMILLRLADLMDMSKDRVSLNIMKLNIEQMNKISQFHWISHAAIDTCEIKPKYEYTIPKNKDGNKTNSEIETYLNKKYFNEKIIVHLYLNSENLMTVKSKECKNIECKFNIDKESDDYKDIISLKMLNKIDAKEHKCRDKCNFMCKWMCTKNEWLIKELQALNKYLSRNEDNNFNTEIYLKIHMQNTGAISKNYLDTIYDYIK